jgi:hypothetical protein
MSNLLDFDDRDMCLLPPACSLRGEADVACSEMAGEASEREVNPFPGRVVGLGILDGVKLSYSPLSEQADVLGSQSTYQIGHYGSWIFWKQFSAGTVQLVLCKGLEEKMRYIRYIPRYVATGWLRTPIIVCNLRRD